MLFFVDGPFIPAVLRSAATGRNYVMFVVMDLASFTVALFVFLQDGLLSIRLFFKRPVL
ncbi:MAG: hypothetical protein UX53_C0022G0014 [Candidatus Azambacteria bacterium GW2011_GWB2_46_37]|uniref:Uncharacterized protein n=4 Tax=Candidatus Azamiibacteriota TaxID=1752741 RepID=A0A0G1TBH4_9BACT|nr:MAG: hypothetical protein UX33_C0009G0003 [Candidatus Azambacteria bacterium GW2011_GWC1_46_13]KKU37579.1 MAG: hypothetical protein UX51_C0017G0002 [Candidatus Azambacteria bacterium GW2011_GWF2_46_32]KKU38887.1 MAG: hypothetical protein UX53_C0022G0014 [Candidatus Azambacteria bacterium GW2011_GWB2_46_37]KKU42775.1 MAG: hypothetical protein UX56_C0007G0024 [Candidatus Azambacteria bacterium GW2011_GWD2_46_48]